MAGSGVGRFVDRADAGRRLGELLQGYAGRGDVVVLALPRGGVPVAYELARVLGAPLDVLLVRKLGLPWHEELAMGAIAEGGWRVLNQDVIEEAGVPERVVDAVAAREAEELQRRAWTYRGDRPPFPLQDRVVIVVDDGLATGATMRVAARAVRRRDPARVVVAAPVAPPEACASLRPDADEVVCAVVPEHLYSVSLWYDRFEQVEDEEVRALLARSRGGEPG